MFPLAKKKSRARKTEEEMQLELQQQEQDLNNPKKKLTVKEVWLQKIQETEDMIPMLMKSSYLDRKFFDPHYKYKKE